MTATRFRHLNRIIGHELTRALPHGMKDHLTFSKALPTTTRKLQSPVVYNVDEKYLQERISYKKSVIEPEDNFAERFGLGEGLMFARKFNQAKMFYKIAACDDLRLAHEAETGREYDVVIRTRPDLSITLEDLESFVVDCAANKNRVYVHYADVLGSGDQFAMGSREAIREYSQLWQYLKRFQKFGYLPGFSGKAAEELLADHSLAMGLEIRLLPASAFDLVAELAIDHHDISETLLADAKKMKDPSEIRPFIQSYKEWKLARRLK